MRLLVINKDLAVQIRGIWKRHKGRAFGYLQPVEVVPDTYYILNLDRMLEIFPNLKDSKYADLIKENSMKFTVGDGSTLDKKYQQYLVAQQTEV